LRLKLSLRDLAEILLLRGLIFSHEAVREWEAKIAPQLTDALRQRKYSHTAVAMISAGYR
jgi:transposase-like protein